MFDLDWEDGLGDSTGSHPKKDIDDNRKATWDQPKNRKKSQNISQMDFLKRIQSDTGDHRCSSESMELVRCICGVVIELYRCRICSTVYCTKSCPVLRNVEDDKEKVIEDENGSNRSSSTVGSSFKWIKNLSSAERKGHEVPGAKVADVSSKKSYHRGYPSGSVLEKGPKEENRKIGVQATSASASTTANVVPHSSSSKSVKPDQGKASEVERKKCQEIKEPKPVTIKSEDTEKENISVGIKADEGLLRGRIGIGRGRGHRIRKELNSYNALSNACDQDRPVGNVKCVQDEGIRKNPFFSELKPLVNTGPQPSDFPERNIKEFIGKPITIAHVYRDLWVHCVPSSVMEDEYEDVVDEINDNFKDSFSKPKPKVGELACVCSCEEGTTKIMSRAKILENLGKNRVKVQLLDVGGESVIDKRFVVPINTRLMKMPLVGFRARINGMPENFPNMTSNMFKDYRLYMQTVSWKLKSAVKSNFSEYLIELASGSREITPTVIKNFGLWEWEKLDAGNGCLDDNIICKSLGESQSIKLYDATVFELGPVRMECCLSDPEHYAVDFRNIQTAIIENDQAILSRKIQQYVSSVKPSSFCPKIRSLFICKSGKQWKRALRASDAIITCIDTMEIISFHRDSFEVRRVPTEFFAIPAGTIQCDVERKGNMEMIQAKLRERVHPQQQYSVEVLSLNPKTDTYVVSSSFLETS